MMNEQVQWVPIVIVEATTRGDQMQNTRSGRRDAAAPSVGLGDQTDCARVGLQRAHGPALSAAREWRPSRRLVRRRALGGLDDWLVASFRQHRGNADVVRQELQRVHGLQVSLRTVERAGAAVVPTIGSGGAGDRAV